MPLNQNQPLKCVSNLLRFDHFFILQIFNMFQLYNEDIIDLLTYDRSRRIKIHEDSQKNEIYLKGVTSWPVDSPAAIVESLRNGALNRTTAATNMNQQSSRSHAIFTVFIKQQQMVPIEV